MRTGVRHRYLGLGLVMLAVAACSTHAQRLRPAGSGYEVTGLDWAAVDAENQIEVILQTRSWPGDPRVLDEVEPLRVRIGNYGFRAVQLRYDGFRLVSERGEEYAPLLPIADEHTADGSAQRAITPRFSSSGFTIARCDAHVYSTLLVRAVSLFRDESRARRWKTKSIPMREPLEWAIPEGILEVGGFVDGYMFFEHVPARETRVRFEAIFSAPRDLPMKSSDFVSRVSAKTPVPEESPTHDRVASVSIPLEAD